MHFVCGSHRQASQQLPLRAVEERLRYQREAAEQARKDLAVEVERFREREVSQVQALARPLSVSLSR